MMKRGKPPIVGMFLGAALAVGVLPAAKFKKENGFSPDILQADHKKGK